MILVTGNKNYGLAEALYRLWGDHATFISRSNDYDLCTEEGRKKALKLSLECEVFVNCAALWKFHQSILLEELHNHWMTHKKSGLIINVGSTADTGVRAGAWMYPVEKQALKNLNRNLTYSTIGGCGIRTTCISFGYLNTLNIEEKHPDKNKIDTTQAALYINWIKNQPDHININEISIDPIQNI